MMCKSYMDCAYQGTLAAQSHALRQISTHVVISRTVYEQGRPYPLFGVKVFTGSGDGGNGGGGGYVSITTSGYLGGIGAPSRQAGFDRSGGVSFSG